MPVYTISNFEQHYRGLTNIRRGICFDPMARSIFYHSISHNWARHHLFQSKDNTGPTGGLGILRWRCIQKNGWLGFQDPASSMYLGYDEAGWLCCASYKHSEQEYVCPRKRPEGGYVLLVLVEKEPSPIGVRSTDTVDQIKIRDWKSESIMWDFIEI